MSKSSEYLKNYPFKHNKIKVEKFKVVKEYLSDNNFGFIVDQHGDVYAFGENGCGQLGLGHNDDVTHEVKVEELSGKEINIKKIYEGNCCMFAQTVDGIIYSWGSNKWGQLGYRETVEQDQFYKPKKIEFKVNNQEVAIVDIKCGSLHNLALSNDGKVFGWGDNHARQITEDVNGRSPVIRRPVLMTSTDFTIQSIYCYDKTSFMITTNNEVYYYGRDIWGMRPKLMNDKDLGNCDYIEPMKLDFFAEFLICNDDFIFYITTNNSNKIELYKYKNHQPIKLADGEPFKKVKQGVKKQQSTSDLLSPSHQPKQDQSNSLSFLNFSSLSALSARRERPLLLEEVPMEVTVSDSPCPKEEITEPKLYQNKFTKLIIILIEIKNKVEEDKIIFQSEPKSSYNKYAINLSPSTYLWDEGYEIIENDDYNNPCYPVEEKILKDIL